MYRLILPINVCIFAVYIQPIKMKYSAKFYPEKRNLVIENVPVMLSVTYAKNRMFYYIGKRCHLKQWNTEKSELKKNQIAPDGQTSQKFNEDLSKIAVAVGELFTAYEVAKVLPTPSQLREDLKKKLGKETKALVQEDFFSRFDQYIREANLGLSRKRNIRTVYNKLKKFNPDTSFEKLDLPSFQSFLLKDCNLSKNSAISFLNGLRAFIRHANKNLYTTINPFESFKVDAEKYGKPIYISIQERDMFFDANITDSELSFVRDIFVFQCFIGCRYGDLMRLKHSNIINGCIQYIASKTRSEKPRVARVPLSEKAKVILSRHDFPDGRLLPYITLRHYNKLLKDLFALVGLKRIVTLADKKTQIDIQVPICDIASSHMARRVFIGGLHKKNVKNEIIASMSGHVENSKAFSRYYDIDQEDQEQAMKLIQ